MDNTTSEAPKAILFDMDGVLVDNHAFHVAAWKEFCKRHKKSLSEDEFNTQVNGHTVQSVIRYLFGNELSAQEIETLGEEKEEIYRSSYSLHMQPVAGLRPFLQHLKDTGWLLAVATSAPSRNLNFVLDGLQIKQYFMALVDSTGIKNGKPAPDIYLKAAEALNMPVKRCIVFEDSLAGIQAGIAAGMPVIALTTTHNAQELQQTAVRSMFSSFEEIDELFLQNILHEHEA